ncbi:MAG: ABC-2 family transporter protein [Candidatus ainarchaeum sp.]|nr:ABC-2 family transporter protein [Candidatus ainarchaeum sp.]
MFPVLELIYLGIEILSLYVIFLYVPDVLGLTFYDLSLYVTISNASIMAISGFGIWIIQSVTSGSLNNLLIRPANELLLMTEFNLYGIMSTVFSVILLIVLCIIFPQKITFLNFILMSITLIISLPLFLLPVLTIRSLSFWFGPVYPLESAFRSITQSFREYPMIILSRVFFVVFVSITPVGYLGWYLSLMILIGKVSYSWMLWMWLLTIVLDVLMWFVFRFVYKRGLRRYEGFA